MRVCVHACEGVSKYRLLIEKVVPTDILEMLQDQCFEIRQKDLPSSSAALSLFQQTDET